MTLYYQCSDGTKIDLMNELVSIPTPETLLEQKWQYRTISGANGLGKIKSFYKEAVERKVTLEILADTASEFNAIMEKMMRCFETDIRNIKPGRIYWNDYYKEVFIVATNPSEFDELFESVKQDLSVLSVYDFWIKENQFNFLTNAEGEIQTEVDFPFDYGGEWFDYCTSDLVEAFENNSIGDSNFEIRFFGPAIDPEVTINGNVYGLVDIELAENEYVTINSVTKKIIKYSSKGAAENVFYSRIDNSVFNKIGAGKVSIIRNIDQEVSISIFDERGEPRWI